MRHGSLAWRLETALNCRINYNRISSLIFDSWSQTFNCHSPGSHTFMPTVQHIPRGTAPHAVRSLTPTPPSLLIGRDRRPDEYKWHTFHTLSAFISSSTLDSAPGPTTGLGVQFGNWTGGLPAVPAATFARRRALKVLFSISCRYEYSILEDSFNGRVA